MTLDERKAVQSAIMQARVELDAFEERVGWMGLHELYDFAKPVHTSALGIWSTVVDLLRARKGLDKMEPEIDAINLEELFGKENANG